MRKRFVSSRIMGRVSKAVVATAIGLTPVCGSFASDTATQNLTLTVSAINELSVAGGTISLTVNAATAGSAPTAATSTAASYSITTNVASGSTKRITAALDVAAPTNTTLASTLAAPAGATSAGAVTLSTTAQNVVTLIPAIASSSLQITYSFSATVAAGPVSSTGRTVTYTLVDT